MANKPRRPKFQRSYEMSPDGMTVDRAYIWCVECGQRSTRAVVSTETGSEEWAARHALWEHGARDHNIMGEWPDARAAMTAWKKTEAALELAARVRAGESVEDVAEDTLLDDELTEALRELVAMPYTRPQVAAMNRLSVLAILREHGPSTVDEIQEVLGFHPGRTLKGMEKQGKVSFNDGKYAIMVSDALITSESL